MIVIRVELHSAINGRVTELARMLICNTGVNASGRIRDYSVDVLRGRSKEALDKRSIQRKGKVIGHPSLAVHIWYLVAKALASTGYVETCSDISTTGSRSARQAKVEAPSPESQQENGLG